jgi:hypothetical protein
VHKKLSFAAVETLSGSQFFGRLKISEQDVAGLEAEKSNFEPSFNFSAETCDTIKIVLQNFLGAILTKGIFCICHLTETP